MALARSTELSSACIWTKSQVTKNVSNHASRTNDSRYCPVTAELPIKWQYSINRLITSGYQLAQNRRKKS